MKSPGTALKPSFSVAIAAVVGAVMCASLAGGTAHAATGGALPSRAMDVSGGSAPQRALAAGWRGQMLTQVNAMRASGGVTPLKPCASLRRAAQDYASVMAQTSVFGHVGPDGTAPWDRMRAKGFSWMAAAENIASGQRSVAQVMEEWAQSPDHLANLMDPRMRQVGFGFAVDAAGTRTYWVQDFGWGTGC